MSAIMKNLRALQSAGSVSATGVTVPTSQPTNAPTFEDGYDDLSSGAIFSLGLGAGLILIALARHGSVLAHIHP